MDHRAKRGYFTALVFALSAPHFGALAEERTDALDGATLYGEHCVFCHGPATFAPPLDALSRMTAGEIHKELWFGVMAEFANGIDDAQRQAIARWIAARDLDKDTRDSGVPLCQKAEPLRADPAHDWPGLSKDNHFGRYVADSGLSAERLRKTRLEWAVAFPQTHSAAGGGQAIAVVGDRLFVGNLNQWVYALDANTGCAHWAYRAQWRIRSNVAVSDGVAVFGDVGANVHALNAETGQLLWHSKADWLPTSRITGNLTVHDGVVYVPVSSLQEVLNLSKHKEFSCCTFRGSIVAYELSSGRQLWKTHTIDQEPEYLGTTAKGTNRYGPSGVVVFSAITVDEKRGLLYVPTGNQMTEPRVAESDAVMALDMKTGAKRWVASLAPEQMGGQDIYHLGCEAWVDEQRATCSPENPQGRGDRDLVAPAILVETSHGRDVLLAGSKDGMLYALDPDDAGRTLWQTRVGRGGEVGGIEWGFASDGKNAYVPVVDMDADMRADGSLTAVDIATGKTVWRVRGLPGDCSGKPSPPCNNAFTSPATVAGGYVFTGTNDGVLRVFDAATGDPVWKFDTVREYAAVNGRPGRGGSLAGYGGTVVSGGRMYIMSGHDLLNIGLPGNVLLKFEIPE